jgi:hypothetical protein
MTRRCLAVVVAMGAMALAAPVSGASAQAPPSGVGFPASGFPFPTSGLGFSPGGTAVGGSEIGSAGCVGTIRPSVGGSTGSTSAQTCGAVLSFTGPQIGQISSVMGPTVIGSPYAQVNVSSGAITEVDTSSG